MTKKKLLILGAGEMQVPIIKKAKELGHETIVADYNPSAPGFQFADKCHEISTLDRNGILQIAQQYKINGVLTTSDAPTRIVAFIAETMGLPGMSQRVSEICTDKYLQRELLRNHVNCPEYKLVKSTNSLESFKDFPYIVKPVDASASRGVKKVTNYNDLLVSVNDAASNSRKGEVIIESFVEGREFSVETFTQNGVTNVITITEKDTCGEEKGYFVEKRHIEPARIDSCQRKAIENEVKKIIRLIGLDNCPSHTEVKINDSGVYLIEIACRLGGDYITSDLVPLSTGIDMLENLINVSLGKPIDVEPKFSKFSCIQFITPDNYNKCTDFIASKSMFIKRHNVEPFEDKEVRNSMDRLGYIILQTATIDELEKILMELE